MDIDVQAGIRARADAAMDLVKAARAAGDIDGVVAAAAELTNAVGDSYIFGGLGREIHDLARDGLRDMVPGEKLEAVFDVLNAA